MKNTSKKTSIMRRISVLLMLCMFMNLFSLHALAGSNQKGYWGNTVENKHLGSKENITIAEVNASGDVVWQNVAYCFNMNRGYPVGAYDGSTYANEYGFLVEQDDATWKTLSENPGYTGDMKDLLTKIVYIGYPYDSNNGKDEIKTILKEQCKVDDEYIEDTYRVATQKAIWHVTDNRPFRLPSSGAVPTGNTAVFVSEYVAQIIYERALAYSGDTGLETRLWKWKGINNRNQHLLDTSYNVMAPDCGNLVITKTLQGDVTAEEAEGALTFKVTGPDGTSKDYTLADFTKGTDGKYTLEIKDVQVGEYKVEETTKTISGKTVTVSHTVNGGQEATGNNATAEVTKDGTATVDFKNNYSNNTGGNTGNDPSNPGGNSGNDPSNPGGNSGNDPSNPGGGNMGGTTGGNTGNDPSNPGGGNNGNDPFNPGGNNGNDPSNPGSSSLVGNNGGNNSGNASAFGQTTSPKTGDDSNRLLWIALLLTSCGGIVISRGVKRKEVGSK